VIRSSIAAVIFEIKNVYLRLLNTKFIPSVGDVTEKVRKVADPEAQTAKAIKEGHDGFKVQKDPKWPSLQAGLIPPRGV
jgi:hypothetical protein